ncbi:MAG: hypothetical protein ACJASX_001527 [Limisphaerales bacterium]|jgi:hypothetical protein
MKRFRSQSLALIGSLMLAVLGANNVIAQELKTGPPEGTVLTPVRVYANSGPYSGREFDAAAEIGQGNGALLFIHQLTRNGLPTLRALDDYAAQYGILNFKSFTLLLAGDRTSAENRLKSANGSLRMRNPIAVCLDGAEGPGNLALNRKCVQSLLLIRAGKIVKSIALTDIADEDRENVRKWIQEVTGPLPVETTDYLKLVDRKLPTDAAALKEFVTAQSIELHRVHRELEVATRGIPKYRGRPAARRTSPNMKGRGKIAPKPKSMRRAPEGKKR